ncbi:hypothetical protein HWV62_27565 [Athelia sp. TMB]|nr:hypothetical protein HWV62_27565 [Athelia sp. TMB]
MEPPATESIPRKTSAEEIKNDDIEPRKRVKTDHDHNLDVVTTSKEVTQTDETNSNTRTAKEKNLSRKRDAAGYPKSRKGKEKEGKNPGRRSYKSKNSEDRAEGNWGPRGDSGEGSKGPRYPKRQCALLIGFCGTGCKGMQYQPDVRTIEGVLFDAMVKSGAVSSDNADDPAKVNLARAARTDAGVHAAGNLVSLKMITTIPGIPDMIACINENLPPEIRAWGYVRVQNSFNARFRKYTYFFPSYMLIPPKPGCELHDAIKKYSGQAAEPHPFWAEDELTTPTDDTRRKRQWRISQEQMSLLRASAKKFEGTHNFHNFTVGRDYTDKSSQRHMKMIEIADPAVYGDTEWISVMIHVEWGRLRKSLTRYTFDTDSELQNEANTASQLYSSRMIHLPKMPSLGLLLENPLFDSYNQRIRGVNEHLQPSDPEYRHPIDFEIHRASMEEFKQRHIYDNLRQIEDRDGIFDAWIRNIDSYGGNDLLYLNSEGVIPAASVLKKGEKRSQPFKETEKQKADNNEAPDQGDEDDDYFAINQSQLVEMEG